MGRPTDINSTDPLCKSKEIDHSYYRWGGWNRCVHCGRMEWASE